MRELILPFIIFMKITYMHSINLQLQFRCHITDSTCLGALTQALLKSFTEGNPALGIKSIDPMKVDFLHVKLDDLIYEFKDLHIQGLKDLVVDQFTIDLENNLRHSEFHTDLIVSGVYNINGSLFFSPICGEGDFSISLKNVEIETFQLINIVKDTNGVDYMDAKKYRFRYDVKDNAEFILDNLYYGDKYNSDKMHDYMNSNWKFVISQYYKPLMARIVDNLLSSSNKILALMPLKIFATY